MIGIPLRLLKIISLANAKTASFLQFSFTGCSWTSLVRAKILSCRKVRRVIRSFVMGRRRGLLCFLKERFCNTWLVTLPLHSPSYSSMKRSMLFFLSISFSRRAFPFTTNTPFFKAYPHLEEVNGALKRSILAFVGAVYPPRDCALSTRWSKWPGVKISQSDTDGVPHSFLTFINNRASSRICCDTSTAFSFP